MYIDSSHFCFLFRYFALNFLSMSDNRKKARRRRSIDDVLELTPIEKTIAKYLRFQCPTKKGMLMGMQVVYFNGTKAIECLTESQWSSISTKALANDSKKSSKHPVCFSSRHDATQVNQYTIY
jgi:hypothetical protein